MDNAITLNSNSSTTRLLTKEKPILEQKPEYKLEAQLSLPSNAERKGEGGLRTKGYFKKSYNNKPLISIVTVVYNGEKHLEQTINSVLEQGYDNVEYIIIDGGSTDGTLDIIKKYEEEIDYWVSEPDSGIYDAMNKGASLCSGEYVAFLNADDWYFDDSIEIVELAIGQNEPGYVFGDMRLLDEDKIKGRKKANLEYYKRNTPLGHQALFVKTKILREMPFDISYKIVADYDLMIKLIKAKITFVQIDKELVSFRILGVSSVVEYGKERFLLHYRHFGLIGAIYSYVLITKQPAIQKTVQLGVSIKHSIQQGKLIWHQN